MKLMLNMDALIARAQTQIEIRAGRPSPQLRLITPQMRPEKVKSKKPLPLK